MCNLVNNRKASKWQAQSLVEFAILLPILLLLILGAMDLGRLFYTQIVITNAAREGANRLTFQPGDKEDGYIETFAAIEAEADSSNVTVVSGDVEYLECCLPGSKVGVKITKTVDLLFDGILQSLGLLGGPVVLTSTVYMVVQ